MSTLNTDAMRDRAYMALEQALEIGIGDDRVNAIISIAREIRKLAMDIDVLENMPELSD